MPGRSTLITVAPRSASIMVANGPASTREKSRIRSSLSAPREPTVLTGSDLLDALRPQLINRRRALVYGVKAHCPQNRRSLRELDVSVIDDLKLVAGRVANPKRPVCRDLLAGLEQRRSKRL